LAELSRLFAEQEDSSDKPKLTGNGKNGKKAESSVFCAFWVALIQLKPDVIVSPTLPGIHAAKQASKTIPIVMVINQDPVAIGMVESLARPGGNVTGSPDSLES